MNFSKEFTDILAANGYKESESGYDWFNDQYNIDCTKVGIFELWLINKDNSRMNPEIVAIIQMCTLSEKQLKGVLIALGAFVEVPEKSVFNQLADICRPDPTGKFAYNQMQDEVNNLLFNNQNFK